MSNVAAALWALGPDGFVAAADVPAAKRKPAPLDSEGTKHLAAKVIGATFVTVVAPIVVGVLLKSLETNEAISTPPAPALTAAAVPLPRPAADQRVAGANVPNAADGQAEQDPPPRGLSPLSTRGKPARIRGAGPNIWVCPSTAKTHSAWISS